MIMEAHRISYYFGVYGLLSTYDSCQQEQKHRTAPRAPRPAVRAAVR